MHNGIPEAGDILWLEIGPARGNEQDGYRPVLVLTETELNELTGRIMGVPITSKIRGWETEVPITNLPKPCVALIDQMQTLAYRERGARFKGERATEEELHAVRYGLRVLLSL